MTLRILHNPRCSKSRSTLQLLLERGEQPEIVEYLKTPPSESELREMLRLLGMPPRSLLRTGEAEYRELGLKDPTLSDDALIRAMLEHPKLIERPIVIAEDRAAIGRPPERVLDIL